MNVKQFSRYLATKAKAEEDVKYAFVTHFEIELSTRFHNDCRTENVLFEFKYSKNFKAPKPLALAIAQSLYYIHRAKFGAVKDSIPLVFIIADKDEAAVFPTHEWKNLYDDKRYDWNLAPSSPDLRLVSDIQKYPFFTGAKTHVYDLLNGSELAEFSEVLRHCLVNLDARDKKYITAYNFEEVYEHWKLLIGEHIDQKDLAAYYVQDVQHTTTYDTERAVLSFRGEQFHVPTKDYLFFWTLYLRPPTAVDMEGILSKADRLNNMSKRRFNGEFYTPLDFAKKGIEYLNDVLGDQWWKTHKFWDMCAGTGNLEYPIPTYENVYLSTLDKSEVGYLRDNKLFPGATVFQYDYLNDDVDLVMNGADLLNDSLGWKLPRKLRGDLADKNNHWIVMINPPFADAGSGINTASGKKRVASGTKLQKYMKESRLGKAGNELFVQFIHRILYELSPNLTLGLYSKLKYINAPAFEDFRSVDFLAEFKNGFVFPASSFNKTAGKWPVGFAIWESVTNNCLVDVPFGNGTVLFDVYEIADAKIGVKTVTAASATAYLNRWVARPNMIETMPPLSSALKSYTKDVQLDKQAQSSVGYLLAHSNELMTAARKTAILSSVYGQGHGWSVIPENFEKSIVTFAVRRVIKHTWLNDRDQFKQPVKELPAEFVNDCLVWALFNGSNQTSSLKDIVYKGKIYQVRNQFFPFTVAELRAMPVKDVEIYAQLRNARDTFVANWLKDKTLSTEAQEVLRIGRSIYALFYERYIDLNSRKFKLAYWDAGWYQVRNALGDAGLGKELFAELKTAYDALSAKLRPQVYGFGFLDQEIVRQDTQDSEDED